jgi:hypothetical protein
MCDPADARVLWSTARHRRQATFLCARSAEAYCLAMCRMTARDGLTRRAIRGCALMKMDDPAGPRMKRRRDRAE